MSWDVLIFDFKGEEPPATQDFKPPSMGSTGAVRLTVSRNLPRVDWSDPNLGILEAKEFSIEFNLGDEDPVTNMMLHVRGTGDPVTVIADLCKATGWRALDCSTGEWLDLADPLHEGWSAFQEFRDRAIGALSCPSCGRELPKTTAPCLYCGWKAQTGTSVSTEPHPAAPGRPPRENPAEPLLVVLRWLWVAAPLGLVITLIAVLMGGKNHGAEALQIILTVHMDMQKARKEGRILPDGRIVAGKRWRYDKYVVVGPDGRRCIGDPWGNPVRYIVVGENARIYSFGPDGEDDGGGGDDVSIEMPYL